MTQDQKIIRAKVGLLELAGQLSNMSQACKMRVYSRDSFRRFEAVYDKGGELSPREISRRRPILKNRVPPEIEPTVMEMAIEQSAWGPDAGLGGAEAARPVDLAGWGALRCVWQRRDLGAMKLRLKAHQARAARDDMLLTERQITALEKAKADKVCRSSSSCWRRGRRTTCSICSI